MGVLIADLDHFKSINDTYGHLAGDAVLREVTRKLQADVRPYDAVGRYGGEEFLVLLPGCRGTDAKDKAERLRETIFRTPVDTSAGLLKVSMSIGGIATADWPEDTPNQILQMVDLALYRAKEEGRNRTVMAGQAEHAQTHHSALELSPRSQKK